MRTAAFLAVIFGIAIGVSAGEGFLSELPKPGTWVKYHRTQQTRRGGDVVADFTGTFTVRFLDEVVENNKKCRWIEFDLDMDDRGNGRYREICKYLVPVESLTDNKSDPAASVIRGWRKDGDNDVYAIDVGWDFMIAACLSPPLTDVETKDAAEVFEYQDGRLRSDEARSGMTTTLSNKAKVVIRHTIHPHADVPNGAAGVRYDLELRVKTTNELLQTVTMDHRVVDFGTGAVSSLPNSH